MKRLLLIFLFSSFMDVFSQTVLKGGDIFKPDTLRVTLIVYYDRGPAILHTKPGFVVRQLGKEEVYLDDKLRVVKSPLEVLTYKIKKL